MDRAFLRQNFSINRLVKLQGKGLLWHTNRIIKKF